MGRSLFTHLVILQAVSLGVVAWAGADRGDKVDRGPASLARLESQQAAETELRGTLTCALPEANTGDSCQLAITQRDNGKILRINQSSPAMRLFNDGKRDVIATGTIQGDSLRVIAIRSE